MTDLEYKKAVLYAAELVVKLTQKLDDEGLTLFEEYCNNLEKMFEYERQNSNWRQSFEEVERLLGVKKGLVC